MEKSDIAKVKSGGKWTALGATVGVFSQLLIMLSLAIFLEPKDVGLFSIFLFVLGLGVTLLPLGNDFSFVQAERLAFSDILRSILVSGLISSLVIGSCYFIAMYFEGIGTSLANIVVFGVLVGLAEAIFLIFSAALQRNLDYKAIEKANIMRQVLTLCLSLLFLAIFHRVEGAFLGRLLSNAIAIGLLYRPLSGAVEAGKPQQKFMTKVARDLVVTQSIDFLSRNVEVLAGSAQLGTQGLGIYDLGRRMVVQPRQLISGVALKFSYPFFSKIQKITDAALQQRVFKYSYKKTVKTIAFFSFPVFSLTLLLADPLVVVVFGSEWSEAVQIVQIFSVAAFIQVLGTNITNSALTAIGETSSIFRIESVLFVPRIVGVIISAFYGPVAIALVMCFFNLLKVCMLQQKLNTKTSMTFYDVFKAVKENFIVTAFAIVVGFGLKAPFPTVAGAAGAGVVFCVVYIVGMSFYQKDTMHMLLLPIRLLQSMRQSKHRNNDTLT
ncbi:oligosaccharide flippase family protein [Pacificibacter marinus]|uniref:Lipopolysaccharide biosynthesis protein WzxC n=1 Tax=Pacificibacter marinus TaxID=658057 RepID=A0A1Y5TUI1_9RHOB|nr:oligosaccharide flippase family protein [Pacificibacter marinus]SEL42523.1 Membrane protein involved in the export of O-antigen and teichoic acid [Pacificibacter marinus]SLN70046.1 Lipopolysaccharide biosynthesis protein WzxC [Pacificibacter marinus]